MNSDVQTLFRLRDEAVRNHDAPQFLSTQLRELPFAASESYLSNDEMTTEVLYTQEESKSNIVVFVRETYVSSKQNQKSPRSSFLIYYVVNTGEGWKIFHIQ